MYMKIQVDDSDSMMKVMEEEMVESDPVPDEPPDDKQADIAEDFEV